MSWLSENLYTIMVSLILILIVSASVRHMIKNKKAGKTSCGCGCSGCAMAGSCHSQNHLTEEKDNRRKRQ